MAIDRFMMRRPSLALAVALAATGLAAGVAAPEAAHAQASGLLAGTLEVPLNKSQVVTADRPIAKAMVGSSEIADILPVTDRSVYVLGKKMGTTSLTLYDSAGRVISIMDIAVGPDAEGLTDQLHALMPGEDVEAHISNDSLVLTGMVSSAGAADRAAQLAKAYAGDKVINLISMGSSQQVMLEVRFAEVQRSSEKDIGVSAGFASNGGSLSGVTGSGASLTSNGLQLGAITNAFGILRKTFTLGGLGIDAAINALETRGLAKTLAQPTLVALSGQPASFLAGGEFPIPVVQSGSSSTGAGGGTQGITVEFKPFGVSLGFTPTVLGDKTISLLVQPEVSSIDPTASITVNNISIPGLKVRRASTTLELRDGESFAIAGLLSRDFQTTVNQIPILGSIPILGALFRSSGYQKGETELLIVVTPHLVAPISPGQVRLPTDRVADPSEFNTFLLGQPYSPQPVAPAVGGASPQAQAQQPAQKGDGYAY